MSHLAALQLNLSNERMRLANAKTDSERALRAVWVAQLEKEVGAEPVETEMTDDEILAALGL